MNIMLKIPQIFKIFSNLYNLFIPLQTVVLICSNLFLDWLIKYNYVKLFWSETYAKIMEE